jgi:hypothetical protein
LGRMAARWQFLPVRVRQFRPRLQWRRQTVMRLCRLIPGETGIVRRPLPHCRDAIRQPLRARPSTRSSASSRRRSSASCSMPEWRAEARSHARFLSAAQARRSAATIPVLADRARSTRSAMGPKRRRRSHDGALLKPAFRLEWVLTKFSFRRRCPAAMAAALCSAR